MNLDALVVTGGLRRSATSMFSRDWTENPCHFLDITKANRAAPNSLTNERGKLLFMNFRAALTRVCG